MIGNIDLPFKGDFEIKYAHDGDAGLDLLSVENKTIAPHDWEAIDTGIAVNVPKGYVGLVHPRSGMSKKSGVTVLNAPGTIDAGYTGNIHVLLINHSNKPYVVSAGDKIAQLLIQQVCAVNLVDWTDDAVSDRGSNGFGSSGV